MKTGKQGKMAIDSATQKDMYDLHTDEQRHDLGSQMKSCSFAGAIAGNPNVSTNRDPKTVKKPNPM